MTAARIGTALLIAAIVGIVALTVAENHGIDFVWPASAHREPKHTPPKLDIHPKFEMHPGNIVISVSKDETILWNGKPISCREMIARFDAMYPRAHTKLQDVIPCGKSDGVMAPQKPH